MRLYQCHKLVKATPMLRFEYCQYRGWTLPGDEDGADEGYLMEYLDSGKANHPQHEGYISWSPKEVFELIYTEIRKNIDYELNPDKTGFGLT